MDYLVVLSMAAMTSSVTTAEAFTMATAETSPTAAIAVTFAFATTIYIAFATCMTTIIPRTWG